MLLTDTLRPLLRRCLQASCPLLRPSCVRGRCRGRDSDSDRDRDRDRPVPASLRHKFETFEEHGPETVRDMHEELFDFRWEEKHLHVDDDDSFYLYRERRKPHSRAEALSTRRGVHGVFDVEDLVEALRTEQSADISVVRVPPHAHYCDFLVLATSKSLRHMDAVLAFVRKLYKLKRRPEDPHLPATVGEASRTQKKSSWQVLDMGHIVLHLFQAGVRETYDLESLWCVGPELDELTVRPKLDPVVDFMEKHMKLIEQLQPNTEAGRSSAQKQAVDA